MSVLPSSEKAVQGGDNTTLSFELTVYYEDTDAGGVVYHSNYLNFMERARSEWMNSIGWDVRRCTDEMNMVFVVKSVDISFNAPARLMDKLLVKTQLIQLGKVRFALQQDIYNQADDSSESQPICSGFVRLAALDSNTFSLTPIPEKILQAMKA